MLSSRNLALVDLRYRIVPAAIGVNAKLWKSSVPYIQNELMIDEGFGDVGIEVRRFDETQEEFVNNLQMRPGDLKHWFIFFRVERFAIIGQGRRNRSKEIG